MATGDPRQFADEGGQGNLGALALSGPLHPTPRRECRNVEDQQGHHLSALTATAKPTAVVGPDGESALVWRKADRERALAEAMRDEAARQRNLEGALREIDAASLRARL